MTRRAAIQPFGPRAAIQKFLHARGAVSGTPGSVGAAAASAPQLLRYLCLGFGGEERKVAVCVEGQKAVALFTGEAVSEAAGAATCSYPTGMASSKLVGGGASYFPKGPCSCCVVMRPVC